MNENEDLQNEEDQVILWRGESLAKPIFNAWAIVSSLFTRSIRLIIFFSFLLIFYGITSSKGSLTDVETLFLASEWKLLYDKHPFLVIVSLMLVGEATLGLLSDTSSFFRGLLFPRKLKCTVTNRHVQISNESGSQTMEIDLAELFHLQINEEGSGRGTITFIGHEELSGESSGAFQRPAFVSIENVHSVVEIIRKAQKQRGLL